MYRFAFAAVAGLAISLSAPGASHAFPEKDITFIIPYSPGGGFDRTVRAIAPYMEKYLPKKVNVIPKNVSGAGGRKGIAQLFRAKADGHTIAVFNIPGMAIPPIMGEKVNYDLSKVSWIARLARGTYVLAVGAKSSIKSFDDVKKLDRPLKITTTGQGSTGFTASVVASTVMGISHKMLTGYKGSKQFILAAVRGDGDAVYTLVTTIRKYHQAGDVRLLASFEAKSSFPGVPTVRELGYTELEGMGLERLVGGPPGVPADRVKILEQAMLKSMADPEFKAKTKKRPFLPASAADTGGRVDEVLKFYLKYKSALAGKG